MELDGWGGVRHSIWGKRNLNFKPTIVLLMLLSRLLHWVYFCYWVIPVWRTGHPYLTFSDISLFFFFYHFRVEIDGSFDVYQNWEELYSKYKWTKIVMTFDLLVGGAVKWAWRTGQEFTKYFWFAYFLGIFSSLDGVRRRQALYVAYILLVLTLLYLTLKNYFRFSLILLENRKNDRDGRDIENVTDGTPLKMYTKWEILKYLFLVSKCILFTLSQTDLVYIDWET